VAASIVPHLDVDRWISQPETGYPLKVFKNHRGERQPRPYQQTHERVCLEESVRSEDPNGITKEGPYRKLLRKIINVVWRIEAGLRASLFSSPCTIQRGGTCQVEGTRQLASRGSWYRRAI
jgi:hypothetical protein